MSARKKIYHYFKQEGLRWYSSEELKEVAEVDDWARVLRQLQQDQVITYEYDRKKTGYKLSFLSPLLKKSKRNQLSSKLRYEIRHRDFHTCQSCGKSAKEDRVKLHVDHKIPVDWGGGNDPDNLWTLCEECNIAKKAFFKDDFDAEVMEKVYKEESAYQRLRVLFENSPNKKFTPSILQGIAGIRDWTRTLRNIRNKYGIEIKWVAKEEGYPNGYYIYYQ